MKHAFFTACLLICSGFLSAQNNSGINLESCVQLAREHYPLTRQHDLLSKSAAYSLQNANKGYFPQININAQVTYQNEVTEIPIKLPAFTIEPLSKDQYKFYGEVSQTLFDGGVIEAQKKITKANSAVEQQKVEVELYGLEQRINQLYFGILLIDRQLEQSALFIKDLKIILNKLNAARQNGTALKSNVEAVQAEILKAGQRETELRSARQAYLDMLGRFIGKELTSNATLDPPASLDFSSGIRRPELSLFDLQKKVIDMQDKLILAKDLPRASAFFQGGYGKPGFNMLKNEFSPFYIAGAKLNWPITAFLTYRKDKKILDLNRSMIDVQREVFLFNLDLNMKQQAAEISRYDELLRSDDEIIALRNSIRLSAAAQLENGVISASDYLREANAEDLARQAKALHEMQKLLSQYNYRTTAGH